MASTLLLLFKGHNTPHCSNHAVFGQHTRILLSLERSETHGVGQSLVERWVTDSGLRLSSLSSHQDAFGKHLLQLVILPVKTQRRAVITSTRLVSFGRCSCVSDWVFHRGLLLGRHMNSSYIFLANRHSAERICLSNALNRLGCLDLELLRSRQATSMRVESTWNAIGLNSEFWPSRSSLDSLIASRFDHICSICSITGSFHSQFLRVSRSSLRLQQTSRVRSWQSCRWQSWHSVSHHMVAFIDLTLSHLGPSVHMRGLD